MPLKRNRTDVLERTATRSARGGASTLALLFAVVLLTSLPASAALAHGDEAEQTKCPVMTGNEIDPDIYTVYQGKKVYFCCQACKAAFGDDPEKYLPRLPQFASGTGVAGAHDDNHGRGSASLSLAGLIAPTGIITLSLVAVTVLLALLRRVRRFKARVVMRIHKAAGVSALISGILHASLIVFFH